jgi:hypothetical protein
MEKVHPSAATLPDLQAQGQNSRPKESMRVTALISSVIVVLTYFPDG